MRNCCIFFTLAQFNIYFCIITFYLEKAINTGNVFERPHLCMKYFAERKSHFLFEVLSLETIIPWLSHIILLFILAWTQCLHVFTKYTNACIHYKKWMDVWIKDESSPLACWVMYSLLSKCVFRKRNGTSIYSPRNFNYSSTVKKTSFF